MTRLKQQDIADFDPSPHLSEADLDDLAVIDELMHDPDPYTVLETELDTRDTRNYETWRYSNGT